MDFVDLSPKWQTILTIAGALLVLWLIVAPVIGAALLARNPSSVAGRRLILGGAAALAVARKEAVLRLMPPPFRLLVESIPDGEEVSKR